MQNVVVLNRQDLWGKKMFENFFEQHEFVNWQTRRARRYNDRKSEKKASLGGRDI